VMRSSLSSDNLNLCEQVAELHRTNISLWIVRENRSVKRSLFGRRSVETELRQMDKDFIEQMETKRQSLEAGLWEACSVAPAESRR